MTGTEAEALAAALVDRGYVGLVLDRLAKQASEVIGAERSSILVRDREDRRLSIVAASNGLGDDMVGSHVPERAERLESLGDAAAPFQWDGAVRGALCVRSPDGTRRFTVNELDVLATLGSVAGAAVRHAQARTDVVPDVCGPIGDFAEMLNERDPYTAEHSGVIVEPVCAVAQALGVKPVELAELRLAAPLHDVGKIRVPDAILSKPGPLNARERTLINHHPVWGAELLACVPGVEVVAGIVRFHHERWDGAGYPDGLSGERIPLASRIIAACDAYHAMTSDRPYRRAMSSEEALGELRANAGTQFDPRVVAAVEAVVAQTTPYQGVSASVA
jgi:HD-GYP domain-containing protein (c-di-GMP phosphodiesterase class II)